MKRLFHCYLDFWMIFVKKTFQLFVQFDQYSDVDNAIFQVQKVENNTLLT